MRYFQSLIENLEEADSIDRADSALLGYLQAIGIEHYHYLGFTGGLAPATPPFNVGSYPKMWIEEYQHDQLHHVDPLINKAVKSTLPILWSDDISNSREVTDPVLDRAISYGLRSGCTIPIRNTIGQLATVTVAIDGDIDRFKKVFEDHQPEIHLGAFHFHNAIERITSPRIASLSPREKICLMFTSQGLSAKSIARILEISPRSIKFHLDNARQKLGAGNLTQAVHLAHKLGLL